MSTKQGINRRVIQRKAASLGLYAAHTTPARYCFSVGPGPRAFFEGGIAEVKGTEAAWAWLDGYKHGLEHEA